jgi:hypothetical protein
MRDKTITRGAFLLASSFALAQCGPPGVTSTAPTEATTGQPTDSAAVAGADKLPAPDMARVCRATVAALNDHDPDIVKVSGNSGEIVQVRYAAASDGKVWTNECRVRGNRVILRTIEAFGPQSGKGRWRTAPMDEVITYKIEGPEVSVTTKYSETSSSTETFTLPN